jgi:hypothetical protein
LSKLFFQIHQINSRFDTLRGKRSSFKIPISRIFFLCTPLPFGIFKSPVYTVDFLKTDSKKWSQKSFSDIIISASRDLAAQLDIIIFSVGYCFFIIPFQKKKMLKNKSLSKSCLHHFRVSDFMRTRKTNQAIYIKVTRSLTNENR